MEPITIRRQAAFDISADQLWALVSDPAQLALWLGDHVEFDLRPGGTGVIDDDNVRRSVVVHEVREGEGWSFTWSPAGDDAIAAVTTVTIDVEATPAGGSRLHIAETFTTNDAAVDQAQVRWETRMLSLWACTVVAALVQ